MWGALIQRVGGMSNWVNLDLVFAKGKGLEKAGVRVCGWHMHYYLTPRLQNLNSAKLSGLSNVKDWGAALVENSTLTEL